METLPQLSDEALLVLRALRRLCNITDTLRSPFSLLMLADQMVEITGAPPFDYTVEEIGFALDELQTAGLVDWPLAGDLLLTDVLCGDPVMIDCLLAGVPLQSALDGPRLRNSLLASHSDS